MYQDVGNKRKIISAWRYPGRTKPKSEAALEVMRQEYANYLKSVVNKKLDMKKKIQKSKWFKTG